MGKLPYADRETWYFGEGSDNSSGDCWVGAVAAVFLAPLLSGLNVLNLGGEGGPVGSAESAAVEDLGLRFWECVEGSVGFGAGGCALSDSVTASAAARSAARWAAWGVDGAAGEAFGGDAGLGAVGSDSGIGQLLYI